MDIADAAHDLSLASAPRASLHSVGREREPVLVIDGVMRRPDALVDYAATEVSFAPAGTPDGGYPGIRAPAPLNYVGALVRAMDPLVRRAFSLEGVALARAECNFSIVTTPRDRLMPLQRIPHVDTVDPLQFAFLHYLCDARFGGTAFYRHRATGFEALTPERSAIYDQARDRELAEAPPQAGYITGDTSLFERTAVFEARFDRLLIYRSRVLHSGHIDPRAALLPDARAGRLTANVFVNYGPSR